MKKIIVLAILLLISSTGCVGTQENLRYEKDRLSAEEGLGRTVSVYSNDGKLIKSYEGKFDIETSDEKVKFDIPQNNGTTKRVIIYNALVIAEEK